MSEIGLPGTHHEVREESGVFYLTPTEAFRRRDEIPAWVVLLFGLIHLGAVVWLAIGATPPWVAVALWVFAAVSAIYLLTLLFPESKPPDPLVLTRAGRIAYQGVVLHQGPVAQVLVVGYSDYEIEDCFHIECVGPSGAVALPVPGFRATAQSDALMPVAEWLASLFGVPSPTEVEMRARTVDAV